MHPKRRCRDKEDKWRLRLTKAPRNSSICRLAVPILLETNCFLFFIIYYRVHLRNTNTIKLSKTRGLLRGDRFFKSLQTLILSRSKDRKKNREVKQTTYKQTDNVRYYSLGSLVNPLSIIILLILMAQNRSSSNLDTGLIYRIGVNNYCVTLSSFFFLIFYFFFSIINYKKPADRKPFVFFTRARLSRSM